MDSPIEHFVDRLRGASAELDPFPHYFIEHVFPEDYYCEMLGHLPPTGVYRMSDDGTVSYDRFDFDRQAIESEREAFFLRITGPGDYRYEGADLGILITRGRVMGNDFDLNDRARNWIRGIKKLYAGKSLLEAEMDEAPQAGSFKIL